MKLSCRIIQKHSNGRRGHRERGREALTFIHPCHRPRIPIGHVLIEHRCVRKHCKREEGARKKRKTNPPQTTKKVPISKIPKQK
jgi:hypothetical protein